MEQTRLLCQWVEAIKACVFQRLILDYRQLIREQCEKQEKARKEEQEYYTQWSQTRVKPLQETPLKRKFKIDNYEIIHVKGILVELWDDAEWEEYERLQADVEQRMQAKLNGD